MATWNRRILSKTSCFLTLLILAGCLTPADVVTELASGNLIISGQVSTIAHRNIVQVGRTAGTVRQPFEVSEAIVKIVDNEGNAYSCAETSPGIYTPATLTAVPGTTYHVEVDLDNRHYTSAAETLPTVVGSETISYDFERKEIVDLNAAIVSLDVINIRSRVNVSDPADPYYLHWDVSETWLLVPTNFPDPFSAIPPNCYITQAPDPQRVVLLEGRNKQSINQEVLIASRVADQMSFHTKHVFYIYQGSITPLAYEYWHKVNSLVSQVGTIFDTPPAEIIGNVINTNDASEKVFGYFQANNEAYTKLAIYSSDLPFVPLSYCEYVEGKLETNYPYECVSCEKARNASSTAPEDF